MRLLPLFLALAVLLCSCAVGDEDTRLGYLERAFISELEGELNGLAFAATLSLGGAVSEGLRDFSIVFSAPESLKGIVLERRAGVLSATCGRVSLSSEAFVGWEQIAEVFCRQGDIYEMGRTTFEGDEVNFLGMACEEGKIRVLLDGETARPLRIEADINGHRLAVTVRMYNEQPL